MNFIAAGIIMMAAVIGAGFGMCYATSKAVDAAARQPEAASRIQTILLLGCALAESTAIYAFVVSLILATAG
ncbi:MAG: ATP synthase F0 subunit C [Oscillospiraceae bacterium]|nr:ATP synthase F0 subunit C [Oscillospiraceae bacterium]